MHVLAQIAYESAVRALDKQERVLEELRVRMTILLTASSIAVSLLGRTALDRPHPVALVVVALCAFTASIAASVTVLLPRPEFVFAIDGPAVFEALHEHRDDPAEIHRRLAYARSASEHERGASSPFDARGSRRGHLADRRDRRLDPRSDEYALTDGRQDGEARRAAEA